MARSALEELQCSAMLVLSKLAPNTHKGCEFDLSG